MANSEGKRYEIVSNDGKTVEILFSDTGLKRSYMVIDLADIKARIREGKEINLNGCYIKDFSYGKLSDGSGKPLMNFHARDSFWDDNVDFSYAQFGDGYVDFSSAQFGDGDVDFYGAQFGDGDVDFCGAQFGNGKVDFSYAQFGDGNVYFNGGAQFGDGNVSFSGAQFGDGDVDFSDAQFGDGKVDFSYAQFGDGRYYFTNIAAKNTAISFYGQIINSHITLSFTVLKKLVFRNCTNHNVIEIQVAFYEHENEKPEKAIHELAFLNVCNLGTIRFNWDEYKNALRDYSDEAFSGDLEKAKTDEFKMLKENYHNQGEYDWEGEANVDFKKRYTAGLKWTKHSFKKLMLKLLPNVCNLGTIRFNWDEYKNALRDYSDEADIKDLEKAKTDEFKMLKENYHNQGEYDWEDEAYVEFKKRYTAGLKWKEHPLKKPC